MTEHLSECPILKPCCDDLEFPEHGFCGNYVGRCLHCMAECICEQLRACETRVLEAAVQRIEALPWTSETWNAHAERAAIIAAIRSARQKGN